LQFEPEFTDAYEIGFKSTILGGTTYLNANVFYQQIHDYQSNSFSGFNFFTLNVPELISQGVEVEVNSRLTDNLTISGGVLYNDAYYDSDATYGGDTITSGTPLSQAPEWTVTGAVNYNMPLGNGLAANFFVNGRYVTDYRTQTLSRNPITDNDAFAIFDARVSLGSEDETWSLEAFVRNLTDEFYYVGGFGAPERTLPASIDPDHSGSNYLVYPNAPRMYGVTLRARY
jgi:outer membrane receptor protein involved in Fe transport